MVSFDIVLSSESETEVPVIPNTFAILFTHVFHAAARVDLMSGVAKNPMLSKIAARIVSAATVRFFIGLALF
jgi:hypothetical protein